MALLQTNKDLISTGMKKFNVLLNQQVSPGPMFQMTCLEDWGAVGEGTGAGREMEELMETARDRECKLEKRGSWSLWVTLESYC